MGDTINSISPDFRDELLKRNLILSDSITNNGLSSRANDLGRPIDLDALPTNVSSSADIETIGQVYLLHNTVMNYNQPSSTQLHDIVEITKTNTTLIGPNYPTGIGSVEPKDSLLFKSNLYNKDNFQDNVNLNYNKPTSTDFIDNDVVTKTNTTLIGPNYPTGIGSVDPKVSSLFKSNLYNKDNFQDNVKLNYNKPLSTKFIDNDVVTKTNTTLIGPNYPTAIGGVDPKVSSLFKSNSYNNDNFDDNVKYNPYQPQSSTPYFLQTPVPITSNPNLTPNYPTSGFDSNDSPLFLDKNNELNFNIGKNIYFDAAQQTPLVLQDTASNPKLGNYKDINNNLNDNFLNQTANIVGSIMRGSIGLDQNGGILTNFDLRNSLAGRVLSGAGAINDTPLGQIGAQQLKFNLLANIGANAQKETLGHINLNPLSLLNGNDVVVKNYSVTVPKGNLGGFIDLTSRILGVDIPKSLLDSSGSIFASESNQIANTYRAQAMIENTGRGQVISLFDNLKNNKYKPSYKDSRKNSLLSFIKPIDEINGQLYVGDDGTGHFQDVLNGNINSPISNSHERFVKEFNGLDGKFVWSDPTQKQSLTDDIGFETTILSDFNKGILKKTQELFATGKMKTIVSALSGSAEQTEIQSSVVNGGVSKGCLAVDANNQFCRTFSHFKGYNRVNRLKRHSGLKSEAGLRYNTQKSVLEDTGFVKIAPYNDNAKKFMFSIENLAWDGFIDNLPEVEQGPGDSVTGTKGRIMWFPPYDLQFTDSHAASWQSTNFIGRSEPVYTYSNTERSGTLQFKVITDFSNALQQVIEDSVKDSEVMSFIHGCADLPASIAKNLSKNEQNAREVQLAITRLKTGVNRIDKEQFSVYFANNTSQILLDYESTGNEKPISVPYTMDTTVNGNSEYTYTNDYGLNKPFLSQVAGGTSSPFADYLNNKCPECVVEIKGFASKQGTTPLNKTLSENRAKNVKNYLINNLGIDESRIKTPVGEGETGNATPTDNPELETIKKDRVVNVITYYDPNKDSNVNSGAPVTPSQFNDLTDLVKSKFFREDFYFNKLAQDSPTVYNSIKEKIQFFHPAFHSTTPEGFNSRLNFLSQCVRQGPTISSTDNPANLAFGKPPICILRIGDFYHSKIVIENVNFSFEQLWDLNPEGIGVQPMIATVDISFKFIGGSSLDGPINKLQNAVSFNFFANTEVYDTRADSIVNGNIIDGKFPGKINKLPNIEIENKKPEFNQKTIAAVEAVKAPEKITDSYSDKKKAMTLNITSVSRDEVFFSVTAPTGGLGKDTVIDFTIYKGLNILGHNERLKITFDSTTEFEIFGMPLTDFSENDTLTLKMTFPGSSNNIKRNFTVPNA